MQYDMRVNVSSYMTGVHRYDGTSLICPCFRISLSLEVTLKLIKVTITSNNHSSLVWDHKTSLTPPHFIEVTLLPPFFQNFHNHSFSSFDNISKRHTSWIIRGHRIHVLFMIISRKTVDTEYTYYSWCMTPTDIVKWRKTINYGNFGEKKGG